MVDDEEYLIAKFRKWFGIEDKTKRNYSNLETSGTPYCRKPNPPPGEAATASGECVEWIDDNVLSNISRYEFQDIIEEHISNAVDKSEFVADDDRLIFDDDD